MRLNVRTKLYAGFGIVIAMTVVASVVGITGLRSLSSATDSLFEVNFRAEEKTGEIERNILLLEDKIIEYIIVPATLRPEIHEEIVHLEGELEEELAGLRAHAGLTAQQHLELDELEESTSAWFAVAEADIIHNVDIGNIDAAIDSAIFGEGAADFEAAFEAIENFAADTVREAELGIAGADSTASRSTTILITVVVIAVAASSAIAFWLARGISHGVGKMGAAAAGIAGGDLEQDVEVASKDEIGELSGSMREMVEYLGEMAGAAQQIADGDLTAEVRPRSERDTLGTAFEAMIANLRGLIGATGQTAEGLVRSKDQLGESAEQAAQATQEVAKTTGQVAEGTSKQARGVQEIHQSVSQLQQVIEQVAQGSQEQAQSVEEASGVGRQVATAADGLAQSAEQAASGAHEAAETAQNGAQMVQDTISGIGRFKQTIDQASDEIARLGERSQGAEVAARGRVAGADPGGGAGCRRADPRDGRGHAGAAYVGRRDVGAAGAHPRRGGAGERGDRGDAGDGHDRGRLGGDDRRRRGVQQRGDRGGLGRGGGDDGAGGGGLRLRARARTHGRGAARPGHPLPPPRAGADSLAPAARRGRPRRRGRRARLRRVLGAHRLAPAGGERRRQSGSGPWRESATGRCRTRDTRGPRRHGRRSDAPRKEGDAMAEQADERQLVVFDLANETYGVGIEVVREIIRMQVVTYVPDSPEYVEGVINLRGRVVPVMDLRRRFHLVVTEETAQTRVLVVEIRGEWIGVIVDAVNEVQRISESSVEPTSALVTTEDSFYIQGIAKLDEKLLILLDLESALGDTLAEFGELAVEAPVAPERAA